MSIVYYIIKVRDRIGLVDILMPNSLPIPNHQYILHIYYD